MKVQIQWLNVSLSFSTFFIRRLLQAGILLEYGTVELKKKNTMLLVVKNK